MHKCYYCFNISFIGLNNNGSPSSGNSNNDASNSNLMLAMVATPNTINDGNWYLDSSATNHITNDPNNLNLGSEYHGKNKLHVGNGVGLHIRHRGHYMVSPSTSSANQFNSKQFHLKNLLHVPLISSFVLCCKGSSDRNNSSQRKSAWRII